MRAKYLIPVLINCFTQSACDFSINDYPGPQKSSSVKESKRHGTFICAYQVKGNAINGIKLSGIFAEKKFSRGKSLFYPIEINCCESQLIIVSSNQPFSTQTSGYDTDWKIIGFNRPGYEPIFVFREYKGTSFPDSIPIKVVAIKGQDSTKVIEKLTLYKIHEK